VTANEFFCENSIIDAKPIFLHAIASMNTELLIIPAFPFAKLCDEYPEIYKKVLEGVYKKLSNAYYNISLISLRKIKDRLLLFLCDEAKKYGRRKSNDLYEIRIPHQHEIAARLGTTRESVSRAINKLIIEGKITLTKNIVSIKIQDE